MDKWDKRFFDLAKLVSTWSKDPSTRVGCVLVNQDRIILGIGYNGFPRGVDDNEDRYNDRPTKYLMVQHAEANAIMNSNGDLRGATAYVTHNPCSSCAGLLIQAGISRVISMKPDGGLYERFKDSFEASETMFNEAGVHLNLY